MQIQIDPSHSLLISLTLIIICSSFLTFKSRLTDYMNISNAQLTSFTDA